MNLKHKFWTLIAKWKYRKQGYDEVCCCGNTIEGRGVHYGDYLIYTCRDLSCPSRCAKEYAITSYIEEKMKCSK